MTKAKCKQKGCVRQVKKEGFGGQWCWKHMVDWGGFFNRMSLWPIAGGMGAIEATLRNTQSELLWPVRMLMFGVALWWITGKD